MTGQPHFIRLIGGRYDGDANFWDNLPRHLWAYPCNHVPRCLGISGAHWGEDDRIHGSIPGAQEYRYSFADKTGHAYVWAPMQRDHLRRLQEAIRA